MEGCFCSFSLCISLHLSISVSVGHHGLWRSGCLSVLLSVHQTVWAAVCQRGTVWPILQSRRLVEIHTLRCLQVSYKVVSNSSVDIIMTSSYLLPLSFCVCRSFGRSHRVLSQQGQLWNRHLPSGADVGSQSAAAAASCSRAVRSGLLLSVHQHKHG